MRKLNWGIVSAGRICDQFTADMASVSNSCVLAVAAKNLKNAEAFAEKH